MSNDDRIPLEVRFAKHRLLPEIGAAGQARLCAGRFRLDPSDPAAPWAAELLRRSGLVQAPEGEALAIPAAPQGLAPALRVAHDATRAAIAATQRVRELVGIAGASRTLRDGR